MVSRRWVISTGAQGDQGADDTRRKGSP
jgi:hypothetical protein